MEAEELFAFTTELGRSNRISSTTESGKQEGNNLNVVFPRDPKVLVRSMSNNPMGSASSDSVLRSRLGKEPSVVEEEDAEYMKKQRRLVRRENGTESTSLSELEFEEVKGFMDLGFVLSETDKDTSLVDVIPGLHRLGKRDEKEDKEVEKQRTSETVPKPYLSESWEWWERRRKDEEYLRRLASMHCEVPVTGDMSDIKRSLRMWAHNVASVVRSDDDA